MKPTFWIGSLLVVPVFAALFSMGMGEERAATRPANESTEKQEFSEGFRVTESEAPTVSPSRGDLGGASRHAVAEIETPPEVPEDDVDNASDPVERAQRLRLPVILAIRGNHPTPEARREAMLEALRNSGPSVEAWTQQSGPVFDDWTKGISDEVGLRADFNSARCYQAGCEVELSFPDRASYERAADEFRSLHEEHATHGGRVQTPAVEFANGELRASWIMLRPNTSDS